MKKIVLIPALAIAFTFGACNSAPKKSEQTNSSDTSAFHAIDTTQLAKGSTFYQCEMHPEVTSDHPGSCPQCGMDLEKIEKK